MKTLILTRIFQSARWQDWDFPQLPFVAGPDAPWRPFFMQLPF
jgi:hypothetical protein